MTFRDSTLNTANLCPAISVVGLFYLLTVMYTFVWFGTLVHFRWAVHSKLWKVGEDSVECILSCIDSGIFWTGIFEMPEVYITVDYVVDRSLERAVRLWRYVELEYLYS